MKTANRSNKKAAVKPVLPWHIALKCLLCALLLLAFACFFSAAWFVRVYGRIGFDSVLYTLTSNLGGVQTGLVLNYLLTGALPTAVCTTLSCLVILYPWNFLKGKHALRYGFGIVLALALMVYAAFDVELVDYLIVSSQESEIMLREYKDPSDVTITFPQQKRNLIYIMLESMETTYLSEELGGGVDENLIPELYTLANDNINFSNNSGVGGFQEVPGSGWTIGAMVAHTSGVPLKTPDTLTDRFNGYGKDGVFLPGLTGLTAVLKEHGYYQALMVGSDVRFGGRDAYYENQGIDKLYDLYTARKDGIVPKGYYVWWGMEDLHLFAYAKQELLKLSQMDQPFAFTMLTVDTHHVGGYTCEKCSADHEEKYENAISCSSRQVAEFVSWLQQQSFYENTTIVIVGDHRTMDNGYISRNVDESYTRHIYNCFINAAATPIQTKNRTFTTVDLFPTTLAAMGCTIEGDRLGLGVNLFSRKPTLAERMGYVPFCAEVEKESPYYAENFFTAN